MPTMTSMTTTGSVAQFFGAAADRASSLSSATVVSSPAVAEYRAPSSTESSSSSAAASVPSESESSPRPDGAPPAVRQQLQFPCIEQPSRVTLSSPYGKSVLSCGKDGSIVVRPLSGRPSGGVSLSTPVRSTSSSLARSLSTKSSSGSLTTRTSALSLASASAADGERPEDPAPPSPSAPPNITDAEEFTLLPADDGRAFLRSGSSGRYVCYDGAFGQGAVVSRTEEELREMVERGEEAPTRWRLARKKGSSGVVLLADGRHDLHLAGCDEAEESDEGEMNQGAGEGESDAAHGEVRLARRFNGTVGCISDSEVSAAADGASSTFWSITPWTGELLFLSSPATDSRIRCNISGDLSLDDNWKGWEVWRFSEVGDGTGAVRISSFCHGQRFLASDGVGRVRTTEDWREEGCRWTVRKAPGNPPHGGVVVQSVSSGRVLSICGKALHTSPAKSAGPFAVWHLEAAHRQHYYISTVATGERMGVNASAPYLTRNPIKWPAEEWRLDAMDATGTVVALYSKSRKVFLGSMDCGTVALLPHMSEAALWNMSESPEGFRFVSVAHGRVLTRALRTVAPEEAPQCPLKTDDKFRLDPSLPRQVNAPKLKTLGIATAVAVGTTVAAPFAIGGAVAVLGAAEMGVAAEAVAIGLTAAEAAAGVALVATTARTLMQEVAVGLEDDREEGGEGCGAGDAGRRPFCGWRNW